MSRSAHSAATLLMEHRTKLYGYILACVNNHHDSEEILQEVCIAVIESFDQLRNPEGFLPWAREIARRRILKHHSRSGRLTVVDPEVVLRLAEAAERIEQTQAHVDRDAALLMCLEKLPHKSQQMIAMRYDQPARSVQEIADRFGRSLAATHGVLKRIRNRLRECVTARLETEQT